jgi:hypothetical protein
MLQNWSQAATITLVILWGYLLKTLNKKAFMPLVQSEEIFQQPTNGKRHGKSRTANKQNEKLIQQHKATRNGIYSWSANSWCWQMPRSFSLYINCCHGNGREGSIVSQRVTILYSEFAANYVHSKWLHAVQTHYCDSEVNCNLTIILGCDFQTKISERNFIIQKIQNVLTL